MILCISSKIVQSVVAEFTKTVKNTDFDQKNQINRICVETFACFMSVKFISFGV